MTIIDHFSIGTNDNNKTDNNLFNILFQTKSYKKCLKGLCTAWLNFVANKLLRAQHVASLKSKCQMHTTKLPLLATTSMVFLCSFAKIAKVQKKTPGSSFFAMMLVFQMCWFSSSGRLFFAKVVVLLIKDPNVLVPAIRKPIFCNSGCFFYQILTLGNLGRLWIQKCLFLSSGSLSFAKVVVFQMCWFSSSCSPLFANVVVLFIMGPKMLVFAIRKPIFCKSGCFPHQEVYQNQIFFEF